MFRPPFIEPDNMLKLGFELVSDENNYLKYQNNGTVHYNKDYNKDFPEPKGKVIIYMNCNYYNHVKDKTIESFYLGIKNDGDTRSSYGGICDTEEFLIKLLNSIR